MSRGPQSGMSLAMMCVIPGERTMAVMVGGCASTCVGSKEQARGRDCPLETVVEVWKLASVPADRTECGRSVDGKGKEKWILLSLMVRLRGEGV